MNELKNKRVSRDDLKRIAKILYDRTSQLLVYKSQYDQISNGQDEDEMNKTRNLVISTQPHFEVVIKTESLIETKTGEPAISWLYENLDNNSSGISKIEIRYNTNYNKNTTIEEGWHLSQCEEGVDFTIFPDKVYYNFYQKDVDVGFYNVEEEIKNILLEAPARLDKTVTKRKIREDVPSLVIGFAIGIIITVSLYLINYLFISKQAFIYSFINSWYYFLIMAIVFFIIGLIIPGKNHFLYQKLGIGKKYVGYNTTKKTNIYRDDLESYKEKAEVEIAEFANHGKIRDKIEENYRKSKVILLIEIITYVVISTILIII